MIPGPVHPHSRDAHWPESAAALSALGFARAFTRCLPPPSNQLIPHKDLPLLRPLQGALGIASGIPSIGSVEFHRLSSRKTPHADPWTRPRQRVPKSHLGGNFPAPSVMQDSDFPRGNHSSAFAAQRTCSCACQARFGIHMAFFTI
jgi:hypothetical protein